jgi:hypothetical protein
MNYYNPTENIPSKEDIEHEVLKAAIAYGAGTFTNEDNTQTLYVTCLLSGTGYGVIYRYHFLKYEYFFPTEVFEGRATA